MVGGGGDSGEILGGGAGRGAGAGAGGVTMATAGACNIAGLGRGSGAGAGLSCKPDATDAASGLAPPTGSGFALAFGAGLAGGGAASTIGAVTGAEETGAAGLGGAAGFGGAAGLGGALDAGATGFAIGFAVTAGLAPGVAAFAFGAAAAAGLAIGFDAAGFGAGFPEGLLAGLGAGLAAGFATLFATGFFTGFGATFLLGFVVAFALAEDFLAAGFAADLALLAGFFAVARAGLARPFADALDTGLRVMKTGLPKQKPGQRDPVEHADHHPRQRLRQAKRYTPHSFLITQKTPGVTRPLGHRREFMTVAVRYLPDFGEKSLRACRGWGSAVPSCRACPSNHPHLPALHPCA